MAWNIPDLSVDQINTAAPLVAMQQQQSAQQQQELQAQQLIKARFDNADAVDKKQVQDVATNAVRLTALKGQPDQVQAFLDDPKNAHSKASLELRDTWMNDKSPDKAAFWQDVAAHEKIGYITGAISPMATKDSGFTLGVGQKRFDASGKEIAAGPPKPDASNQPLSAAGKQASDIKNGFIPSGDAGKVNIAQLPDATTRKAAIESQNMVLSSPDIISNLVRARTLNDQTFDTGVVSANDKMSLARGTAFATDANKKTLENTAEYQNIIDRQVVTQMKTMFTRPTEYETKLVRQIEGSLHSSIPERAKILDEAINYLQQRDQQARDSLDSLGVKIKEPTKQITGDQRKMAGGGLNNDIGNADASGIQDALPQVNESAPGLNLPGANQPLQTPSGLKYRVIQ